MDRYSSLGVRSTSRVLNPSAVKQALKVSEVVIEKVSIVEENEAPELQPILESVEPNVAHTEPVAVETEAAEPEAAEPEAAEPAAVEPAAVETEAAEPAAVEPEAVEPEAAASADLSPERLKKDKSKPRTNFR